VRWLTAVIEVDYGLCCSWMTVIMTEIEQFMKQGDICAYYLICSGFHTATLSLIHSHLCLPNSLICMHNEAAMSAMAQQRIVQADIVRGSTLYRDALFIKRT
jgi:hypothetical protein